MRTPTVVSLIVFAAVTVVAATPPVPLRTVTGEVVDAAGRPVAGATVRVTARYHAEYLGDDDADDRRTMPAARTGRDGRFRMEVPVAMSPLMGLEVSHPRHLAVRRPLVPGFRDVDLPVARLPARGTATVVLLDPEGRPAPGVRVRARALEGDAGHGWLPASVWTRSDDEGRLPVPGVAGRTFWSGVGPRGWLGAVLEEPGAADELRLDPVREARVVDEDGEPLGGRVVRFGTGVLGAAEDAVALPEDREMWERLWLREADGTMRSLRVALPDDPAAPLLLVAAEPEPAPPLRVAVTDAATGSPIAGAYVLAGIDRLAVTGPGGVAELRAEAGVAEWDRQVWVIAQGYSAERRELEVGDPEAGGTLPMEFRLRSAGRLRGTVLAAGSPPTPVAGARIEALPVRVLTPGPWRPEFPELEWPAVRSGSDGRFEVAHLERERPHLLRVTAAGHAPLELAVPAGAPDEPIEVVLAPSLVLAGEVVDEAGTPVADAAIELARHVGSPWERRLATTAPQRPGPRTVSDAAGRFAFVDLAAGTYRLLVDAPGFVQSAETVRLAPDDGEGPLRITLDRGRTLTGVVLDAAGEPAAGAEVEVFRFDESSGLSQRRGTVVTGDDGTFRIDHLPDWLEGRLQARDGDAVGEVALAGSIPAEPLVVDVAPRRALRGVVVDRRGRAVAKAQVRLQVVGPNGRSGSGLSTSADGSFEFLHVGAGRATLSARGEGVASFPRVFELGEGVAPPEELRLVLESELAGVFGRVLGPGGAGRGGVPVEVSLLEPHDMGWSTSVETDAAGRFVADELVAGAVRVTAFLGDAAASDPTMELELAPGEHREVELVAEARPSQRVAGRVGDDRGEPVVGAIVTASRDGSWSSVDPVSLSDAAGRFAMEVEGDDGLHLWVRHDDWAPAHLEITAGGTEDLEIVLAAGGSVSGRLVGWDEGARSRLDVHLWREGHRPRAAALLPKGRYRADHLAPGTWRLVAEGKGVPRLEVAVEVPWDGAEVTLDLEAPGRGELTGRVVREGLGVGGARVLLECESITARTVTSADGRFALHALPLDVVGCRLGAVDEDQAAYAARVLAAGERDVTVALPVAVVAGWVVDGETRQPVAGARVWMRPVGARSVVSSARVLSDGSGRFVFPAATPGRHRLQVTAPGYRDVADDVTVGDGSTLRIEMAPAPGNPPPH